MSRLIGADSVVKKLEWEIENLCQPVPDSATGMEAYINRVIPKLIRDVINYINAQPTVDAVEVVHGRWEDVSLRFTQVKEKCSVCGGIVYAHGFNYCPNCGAKMDGDR